MARTKFADILYQRRRSLGLSIPQAAKVLRMRESVLEAFEAGDFDHLPALGYAQGMVASYARYLGLDSRQITELYEQEHADYVAGVTGQAPRGLARLSDEPQYDGPASATSPVRTSSMTPTSLPSGRSDLGRDSYGMRGGSGQQRAPYDYRDDYRGGDGASAGSNGSGYAGDSYGSRGYGSSYESYRNNEPSERRYTTRNPNASANGSRRAQADRYRRSRSNDESYNRNREHATGNTVTFRAIESDRYSDDLRFGTDASSYRPSSTRAGRQQGRNISSPDRPNVRRRQPSGANRDPRSRNGRQQPQKKGFAGALQNFASDPRRVAAAIVLALVVVLVLIISTSVRSCTSSKTSNEKVNVVTAVTSDTAAASTSASTLEQQVLSSAAEKAAASSAAAASQETVVSISVDDSATTWIEITCDGEQKVAESVTGAWSQEYTVTKSIEIRVGDPSVVTVTKNGERQVFGNKSAGVSSLTIQGTDPSASTTDEAASDETSDEVSSDEEEY